MKPSWHEEQAVALGQVRQLAMEEEQLLQTVPEMK
jgi:hypothetical protein